MEFMIIMLLLLLIIINAISIIKNNGETNLIERIGKMELSINKELSNSNQLLTKNMNEDFNNLNEKIERKLYLINEKVNERIDENFEKTNKTFTNVLDRLSKIDAAQAKIDHLSSDIVSLQSILTDKKTRGIFGEVNLHNIMTSIFGESSKVYKLQYGYNNGTIVDCVLFAPEPLGTISIDSKFPLENYRNMVDKKNGMASRISAEKLFKSDVKKHIDAIADKYIIPGITSDQAIMFLPAEAIFAELNAYHGDIIDYAYKKRVWITSPTTLTSTLTTIEMIIKNMERDKYASIIHTELKLLNQDFKRYRERWSKLSRSIETVNKDIKDINVTTEKISKRFDSINLVEVEDKELNL